MWDKRDPGTETTYRGGRKSMGFSNRAEESHRKLDPIPDRVHGRRIVVSPKTDIDKGKYIA